MDIVTRIKKWFVRLFVLVRKKLRGAEDRLDEKRPPRLLGLLLIVVGVALLLLGILMLVLPGPGLLTIALGIVCCIVGYKVVTGQYGPERKERERRAKHERLRKRRAREND